MKNLYKSLAWIFLIVGILLVAFPYLGCMGTGNDFQCLVVNIMFSTSKIVVGSLFLIGGIVILAIKQDYRKKSTIIIAIILVLAFIFISVSPRISYNISRNSCNDGSKIETVMKERTTITTIINGKTLTISSGPCYERTYSWDGGTCTILQEPRTDRWYGSLGIYSPSAKDWKSGSCLSLNHAVVEEGQQHFSSVEDILGWLHGKYNNWQSLPESEQRPSINSYQTIYSNNGLVVSWKLSSLEDKQFLNVSLWQVDVNGTKPTKLEGAQDDKIKVVNSQ